MRDTFVHELVGLALRNPDIYLITGDLGFGVLTRFRECLPGQFINAGVAEQNMTGLATGLAMLGKIPFTYSIGNFPTLRCLEQIRNDACYHDANVKTVSVGGGFSYGALGMSHHATEDLSIMRALPNVTIVAPGCRWETAGAVRALVETPGPCYLRLDKSSAPDVHGPDEVFVLGRARVLRWGNDVTLVASGGILGEALEAASELDDDGISCRVISMHTLRPFDRETILDACSQTGGIVTVEENTVDGGLGAAVAETCLEAGTVPGVFCRVGIRGKPSSVVGSQQYLRHRHNLDSGAISEVVRARLGCGRRTRAAEPAQRV